MYTCFGTNGRLPARAALRTLARQRATPLIGGSHRSPAAMPLSCRTDAGAKGFTRQGAI